MVSNTRAKDCTVAFVYNSMYLTVNTFVKRQTAALLAYRKSFINDECSNSSRRIRLWVFHCSIVYCTCGKLFLNKNAMRAQLMNCLEDEAWLCFLWLRCIEEEDLSSQKMTSVYCLCRMPKLLPMIKWNQCNEWFHVECEHIPAESIRNSSVAWKCGRYCH